jgi:hypothetical protein
MTQPVMKTALWTLLCFGLLGIAPAAAYLDPGTGSIILQAVIGAVAGALIVIKLYWYKLTSFLRGLKSNGASAPGNDRKDDR